MNETNWHDVNRANWDERVKIHLSAESYNLGPLRSGHSELTPIEESEIGLVDGLRVLHLQCHFGRDTLTLAQRGATVVGVDFSVPAIAAARGSRTNRRRADSSPMNRALMTFNATAHRRFTSSAL
jgi:2-polyprenyl-3-methyl-5-hydroxy-6-metoxy-1,4-benzoquinol methylase